jgi:hypothetical protein
MALHASIPSKSTGGQTAIKDENTDKIIKICSSSEADVRVCLDSQIHAVDVGKFAQFGFEEQVRRLANRSGFQPVMIRDVYKHVSSFRQMENITKAMHAAAVECAIAKIQRRVQDPSPEENSEVEDEMEHDGENDGEDVQESAEE